jgi:hypothetical protein
MPLLALYQQRQEGIESGGSRQLVDACFHIAQAERRWDSMRAPEV